MKRIAHAVCWFFLPAAAAWVGTTCLVQPPPAPAISPAGLARAEEEKPDALFSRVQWKSPDHASTPEWEALLRMLATTTDTALLWKYLGLCNDDATCAFIQRRLVELDPAGTITRAVRDSEHHLIDTWANAIAWGWAVHQTDDVLTATLRSVSGDLRKIKEPGVHHAMLAFTRCLGVERVLRLGLAAEFDALPATWQWIFQHMAMDSPEAALQKIGLVKNPALLAAARQGLLRGLADSRPDEALRLLETDDFSAIDSASTRLQIAEKSPASLMPVLARHPELRKQADLLDAMAKNLGRDPQAAAWGNSLLEGGVRREFLSDLAKAQAGWDQRAALDTLAMLPEPERISFLEGSQAGWDAAALEHPVL